MIFLKHYHLGGWLPLKQAIPFKIQHHKKKSILFLVSELGGSDMVDGTRISKLDGAVYKLKETFDRSSCTRFLCSNS